MVQVAEPRRHKLPARLFGVRLINTREEEILSRSWGSDVDQAFDILRSQPPGSFNKFCEVLLKIEDPTLRHIESCLRPRHASNTEDRMDGGHSIPYTSDASQESPCDWRGDLLVWLRQTGTTWQSEISDPKFAALKLVDVFPVLCYYWRCSLEVSDATGLLEVYSDFQTIDTRLTPDPHARDEAEDIPRSLKTLKHVLRPVCQKVKPLHSCSNTFR